MKKLSIIAAAVLSMCSLGAVDLANINVNGSLKFQTETVNRGRREGKTAFVPSAEIGIKTLERGELYAGVKAILSTGTRPNCCWNDMNPYAGFIFNATDTFTFDVGYKHHFYTDLPKGIPFSREGKEVYAGILYDAIINPAVYGYYDFDREEMAFEASVSYLFDLSEWLINGLGVEIGAIAGYDRADKPAGYSLGYVKGIGKKDYVYYGANADLVLSVNDNVSVHAGINYTGNTAKKVDWPNHMLGHTSVAHKNMMWFSTSIDCKF